MARVGYTRDPNSAMVGGSRRIERAFWLAKRCEVELIFDNLVDEFLN